MREILFRGKRIDNGEWIEGYLAANDLIAPDYPEDTSNATGEYYGNTPYAGFVRIDPSTVGQFTGIYDKNGKKIFEGNIVRYYGTYALEVFIEKGHTKFRWFDAVTNTKCEELFFGYDEEAYGECEIIGNIHDNNLEDLNGD